MKKYTKYILMSAILLIVLIISIKSYDLFTQYSVRSYMQSLSADGLDKIEFFADGKTAEIYDADLQQEILSYISKIEPAYSVSLHSAKAPGAGALLITLIYQNGTQEYITLPVLKHKTFLGSRYFYCTIDGDEFFTSLYKFVDNSSPDDF